MCSLPRFRHWPYNILVLHDLLHDTIGSMTEAELAGRFGAETARLAFAFADPPLAPGAPDTWRAARGLFEKARHGGRCGPSRRRLRGAARAGGSPARSQVHGD